MARFHFNLRSRVAHATAQAVVSQRTPRALRLEGARAEEEVASRGPGWFESSWELIRGLEVCEGVPGDARLTEWLAACLRADLDAASAVAERGAQPGARRLPAPSPPRPARVATRQLGDLDFAGAADATLLDPFSEFGIDGLELA